MVKNYSLVAFYFALFFLSLTGCQVDEDNSYSDNPYSDDLYLAPVQKRPDSENSITVKTKKAEYSTRSKEIIVELLNDSNKEYITGIHVFLEKKVGDMWYEVPMKANSFTEQAIIHPPNQSSALALNVKDLKNKLTPGEYRAVIGGLAAPFKIVE